jgi:DedD protein
MRDRGQRDGKDSEVTLSPASLLGIFLGLVLVCGVFFGFGYSVGRRAVSSGSVPASADGDAEGTDTLNAPIAKPPAARTTDDDDAAAIKDSSSSHASDGRSDTLLEPASTAPVSLPVSDAPATAEAPVKALGGHAAPPRGALNNAAGTNSTPSTVLPAAVQKPSEGEPETGRTVVQVAAVTHQEDADVLVSALRQKGYHAMERSEPQDKLLHVQVGPFSSREDANTMKQKLLADGYNAIIKQ